MLPARWGARRAALRAHRSRRLCRFAGACEERREKRACLRSRFFKFVFKLGILKLEAALGGMLGAATSFDAEGWAGAGAPRDHQ